MHRQHCRTIAAVMELDVGHYTPSKDLMKNFLNSPENHSRSPTDSNAKHRRFHSSLKEVKRCLFEMPLPKNFRVQPGQSYYIPHRYKTIEDQYAGQLELIIRAG